MLNIKDENIDICKWLFINDSDVYIQRYNIVLPVAAKWDVNGREKYPNVLFDPDMAQLLQLNTKINDIKTKNLRAWEIKHQELLKK